MGKLIKAILFSLIVGFAAGVVATLLFADDVFGSADTVAIKIDDLTPEMRVTYLGPTLGADLARAEKGDAIELKDNSVVIIERLRVDEVIVRPGQESNGTRTVTRENIRRIVSTSDPDYATLTEKLAGQMVGVRPTTQPSRNGTPTPEGTDPEAE